MQQRMKPSIQNEAAPVQKEDTLKISKQTIDATDDLFFTRGPSCIEVIEPCCEFHTFEGFHFVCLNQRNRIARFLSAIPHLWRYTK